MIVVITRISIDTSGNQYLNIPKLSAILQQMYGSVALLRIRLPYQRSFLFTLVQDPEYTRRKIQFGQRSARSTWPFSAVPSAGSSQPTQP